MQQRIKDTGNELLIVFVIGGLIGSLVSWASNTFVAGVQFFTHLRESTHFLQTDFGHLSLEFTSLIFLWIAGLLVITIRKLFVVIRWHGPADTIFTAQQTKIPLDKTWHCLDTSCFYKCSRWRISGPIRPLGALWRHTWRST
jgi:CIC family chloride channel protein